MAPIFAALGGPAVAVSFGAVPNRVELYDTSRRDEIERLYADAENAESKGHSSFVCWADIEECGPTLKEATTRFAVSQRVVWADLDESPRDEVLYRRLISKGCVVVASPTPGNRHVLLVVEPVDVETFRRLLRKLKLALGADHKDNPVSWLRLPYARSFKDKHLDKAPPLVSRVRAEPWSPVELEALLDEALKSSTSPDRALAQPSIIGGPIAREEVNRGALPRPVRRAFYDEAMTDRSVAGFVLMKECAKNGLSRGQAKTLAVLGQEAGRIPKRWEDGPRLDRQIHKAYAEAEQEKTTMEEKGGGLVVEDATGPVERVRWLWDRWIPLGELTLIAGYEESKKSTFCIDLAARVSRGSVEGEWSGEPRSVFYIATEDSWHATVVPRLKAADAELGRVKRIRPMESQRSYVNVVRYIDQIAELVEEHDVGLIVFDPIASALGDSRVEKEEGLREALDPIIDMADRLGIAVLGIKHFTKLESADPAKLMGGNRAWSMIARSVLIVAKDPDDEMRMVIGVHKNNLAPKPPARAFSVEPFELLAEGERATYPRIVWEGESDRTPQEALTASLARERAASNEKPQRVTARSWLHEYLAENGPTPRPEAIRAARALDMSARSVDRAYGELRDEGVTGKRHQTQDGQVVWSLAGGSPR